MGVSQSFDGGGPTNVQANPAGQARREQRWLTRKTSIAGFVRLGLSALFGLNIVDVCVLSSVTATVSMSLVIAE